MEKNDIINDDVRANQANTVTWVGFFTNVILTALKLCAGIFGRSNAMIADSIHSLSDFATDIVVLVSFRIIRKPPDVDHNYGHGKYETLATTIIGAALFIVGFGILYSGAKNIYSVIFLQKTLESPGLIAFFAALLSIIAKEILYRYTIGVGKRIKSQAVIANAWHHRSDAFSSIGTLLGIGGAIFLGEKWTILDPIAAVVISFFILKVAYSITLGSLKDLLEVSIDEKTKNDIFNLIKKTRFVIDPHEYKTRKNGNKIIIDIHIRVPNNLNIVEAHEVCDEIESKIKADYGNDIIINIHTEPEKE